VRAPIAGLAAALGVASHDLSVVLPVDCPLVTAELLGSLADACTTGVDAAVPQTGPLPGAYRRSALPALERGLASGQLSIRDVLTELETVLVRCNTDLLVNVNTSEELQRLR
jgi:molybdopterin-guanine dinucleotide biosynthesis protein A